MELLGPYFFFIVLGVFGAGCFSGFLRDGKLIASGRKLTPAGTIGLVVFMLVTGFGGIAAAVASIRLLEAGLLSDNSTAIGQVMPYAITFAVAGAVLLFTSGWLLVSSVRRALAVRTQPPTN